MFGNEIAGLIEGLCSLSLTAEITFRKGILQWKKDAVTKSWQLEPRRLTWEKRFGELLR